MVLMHGWLAQFNTSRSMWIMMRKIWRRVICLWVRESTHRWWKTTGLSVVLQTSWMIPTQAIKRCLLVSWGRWLMWEDFKSHAKYISCQVMYMCQDKGGCNNYTIILHTSVYIITQGSHLNQLTQILVAVILRRDTSPFYLEKWNRQWIQTCPNI